MRRSTVSLVSIVLGASLTPERAIASPAGPIAATVTVATAADSVPRYTKADVRFLQGMIAHHAQALAMVALVPSRGSGPSVGLLAQRIEVSQKDEIKLMQQWLADRHESVPNADLSHQHEGPAAGELLMPGMLTPKQMTQLADAKGFTFNWLFLEGMIQHHAGAITMVKQLFAVPGAGQVPEVFRLATDIEADQRAEIRRMNEILNGPAEPRQP